MLTLDGPQRLCGQVSLHGAGRIEARFTVRKAGQYVGRCAKARRDARYCVTC